MGADLLIAAERIAVAAPGAATRMRAGFVRVADGVIAEVGHGRPPREPDVELGGAGVLVPGLVDLQLNGYGGHHLADADADGWARVARLLPTTGVTAFLPTFVSAPIDALEGSLARARAAVAAAAGDGARMLGVHVEGPFLSDRRAGAHHPEVLCDPRPELVERLLAAGDGLIALVTLAPERAGAHAAIGRLVDAGVLVSVGHSDATAAEVADAAAAGARMVTHLFNAQSGIDHRRPGVAAQALVDERLTLGLIADLEHVAPAACRLAFTVAGGRIALVSDAVAPAGLPAGRHAFDGQDVTLPEHGPPRRLDGVLFGSALRLDEAIANVVGLGVDLAVAIDAASRVPADLIGRPDLGRIAAGAAADLVWLDERLRTTATWIAGEAVFGETRPDAGGRLRRASC